MCVIHMLLLHSLFSLSAFGFSFSSGAAGWKLNHAGVILYQHIQLKKFSHNYP